MRNDDDRQEAGLRVSPSAARFGLFILFLVACLNYLDRYIISILMEPIRLEFALTDTQIAFLSGFVFAVFYATLGLPLARYADRGNRRKLLSIALGLWSTMTALGAAATGFWTLLLARIGVGVGEAGAAPASHSLIADYFPPERRGSALGILSAGGTVGFLLAFILGGLVAQAYGWRWALLVAGIPGILVAIVVWIAQPEPRDLQPLPKASVSGSALADFHLLWKDPAYRHLIYASTLWMFVGYGAVQWVSAFFMRVHGLTVGEVGIYYGTVGAAATLVGALGGGILADRLAKKSLVLLATFPAVACIAAYPLQLPVFMLSHVPTILACSFIAGLVLSAAVPAMYAVFHAILPDRLRGFGIAFLLFIGNFVGLGFGPLILGMISDALTPHYGNDGLRFALIGVYAVLIWAGLHYLLAARHIRNAKFNGAGGPPTPQGAAQTEVG